MLFNSEAFLFAFLPFTLIAFFLISKYLGYSFAKFWLVSASLFFYGFWNPNYLVLIVSSVVLNFYLSRCILVSSGRRRKFWASIGVVSNLLVLSYFKYMDFIIININGVLGLDFGVMNIVLPLAISFFTFQQISFLLDSYSEKVSEQSFLNYVLYVTFFPQLIAGPIVHHSEIMPQFSQHFRRKVNWKNVNLGMLLFSIGLFKKVVLADTFSVWADTGFAQPETLRMISAWQSSLSYTLQLYFDFSGYADMAIGIALMFNIQLPLNFNSPYKSLSIKDFWRRWHMTLSRWLRDYLYIPLGGNRHGSALATRNVIITFLLGGLWHGAAWTFVVWGGMHGVALAIHRVWESTGIKMPKLFAWILTFVFINVTWVLFRASDLTDAGLILKVMFNVNQFGADVEFIRTSLALSGSLLILPAGIQPAWISFCIFWGVTVVVKSPSAIDIAKTYEVNGENTKRSLGFLTTFLLILSVLTIFSGQQSSFLYFDF
ncbi:MBOAT family protein [Agarivorans sp. 1_MG-2023]|uniref:MBOAT family O-acyltransferase n=1 Tax=Agarivorans sp. 1_MG-2023 TaxID=3062634 RepID=UPI0026E414EF|nr:MBOAT family protein [Agarivorans sp. 1_MG-2023]MDO6766030.1 MBOAT family protein [Agarivorans sp. 1_MG-2023]